eukprot:5030140-Pleurochrysis_carterae.AAC.1
MVGLLSGICPKDSFPSCLLVEGNLAAGSRRRRRPAWPMRVMCVGAPAPDSLRRLGMRGNKVELVTGEAVHTLLP